MGPNIQAFLRINILNFQAQSKQPVDLADVKTRVELKEKLRTVQDQSESKPQRPMIRVDERPRLFRTFQRQHG